MDSAIIPIGVAYAQLLDDVRAVIRHELHNAPTPAAAPPADDPLSIQETASMLGVTVQTVHEWKRLGLLKFYKIRGRSYVLRSDVMTALQGFQRTKKGR